MSQPPSGPGIRPADAPVPAPARAHTDLATPPAHGSGPLVPPHRPGPSWRSELVDPTLGALVTAGRDGADVPSEVLATFWQQVAVRGTPLVHDLGDTTLLTFLWRADAAADGLIVQANRLFDATRIENSLLRRLPGTDVWLAAFEVPAQWRGSYQFVQLSDIGPSSDVQRRAALREHAGRAALADPFNHAAADAVGGPLRIAQGHRAPEQPWFAPRPSVPPGRVRPTRVDGPRPGEQRQVWEYRPPGRAEGLLVLLDGEIWAQRQPIWPTLDNLVAAGEVPPLQAVLIESGGRVERTRDLACNPDYAAWLLEGVLPRFALPDIPAARSIVAGQSLGGLAAVYLGHLAPERFDNVLSQSGAFWFANRPGEEGAGPDAQWLTAAVRDLPQDGPRPRCHLEVGTLEWVSAPLVRRMRDVLRDRGTDVSYTEYCGGHDTVCWRDGLATGLRRLTASW